MIHKRTKRPIGVSCAGVGPLPVTWRANGIEITLYCTASPHEFGSTGTTAQIECNDVCSADGFVYMGHGLRQLVEQWKDDRQNYAASSKNESKRHGYKIGRHGIVRGGCSVWA